MLPSLLTVEMSRWQFAVAASFHFLFVPLTLGLTWLLLAMESAYLITKNEVYKDMTRFWGKLLGINFALGVLTGLTMEFQFGTNWAYYSQFVGDIFGTPLAIEGLVAFMLESTFIGLFFFGWDKLSKFQHWCATLCLALGSSLSALLILIANGFMQYPQGAAFNPLTMRMETTHLWDLMMNPFAQVGFAHTVLAGYTTGAIFVLGISGFYLLKKRDLPFAKRSFTIAAGFGTVTAMMVLFMGDQSGLLVYQHQPLKLAMIEGEWDTQPAPAAFNLIAWPSQSQEQNRFAIQIPEILGLIVTHNKHQQVAGIRNIIEDESTQALLGWQAYQQLWNSRSQGQFDNPLSPTSPLGLGMLLSRTYPLDQPIPTQIQAKSALSSALPNVFALFWTFRIMVGLGVLMFLLFLSALWMAIKQGRGDSCCAKGLYAWALLSIPFPFVASLSGWFVTEQGRQPWTVYNILPTTLSASTLTAPSVMVTMAVFALIYTALFAVELYLMFKFARLGPSALHTGRYHFETLKGEKTHG